MVVGECPGLVREHELHLPEALVDVIYIYIYTHTYVHIHS